MKILWMHEFAEEAIGSGTFPDPRVVYDLTPAEVITTIQGINTREKQLQKGENIRIGTLCACVFNQNRRRRNDKIWKWTDFFPEKSLRDPADPDELQKKCLKFMEAYNGD